MEYETEMENSQGDMERLQRRVKRLVESFEAEKRGKREMEGEFRSEIKVKEGILQMTNGRRG